jgi:hypothetical protein
MVRQLVLAVAALGLLGLAPSAAWADEVQPVAAAAPYITEVAQFGAPVTVTPVRWGYYRRPWGGYYYGPQPYRAYGYSTYYSGPNYYYSQPAPSVYYGYPYYQTYPRGFRYYGPRASFGFGY